MFNSKTVFVTIEFADKPGVFYPKHLPIPQIGHEVIFNGNFGKVESVRHSTAGTITEILIKCSELL
jgi:hypothetical protein